MEGDARNLAKTEKRNSFQRMQSKCENHCIMYKGVTQWINLGKIVAAIHLIRIGASVIGFSSKDFFLKKIILGPREVQISWFLVLWSLTHYILRLVFFRDQPTPPICLKMPKCAKFSTFWESHEKNHLQVGVHRENFLIGNLAQNVFMVFYICWEHNISFSAKFPMRKFSPSPSPSLSPESHLLLQNWLKFRK